MTKTTGKYRRHNTKFASENPTLIQLAWAAGFLEGEGTFIASGKTSNEVKATQKQKEPLERLLSIFGGRLYEVGPYWYWCASGERARGIMLTLYIWMSPRRKGQIQKALRLS